jgi:phage gpG-like protein
MERRSATTPPGETVNIQIEVLNGEELAEFMATKAELIVGAVRAEMQEQTLGLLGYIKDEKLSGQVVHQRSRNLKNSGFTEVEEGGGEITGFVGFGRTVPYAAILNYGGKTSPHLIQASNAQALMFVNREGNTIFAKLVHHPGSNFPERNYLETSLEERAEVIREGFEGAIQEVLDA